MQKRRGGGKSLIVNFIIVRKKYLDRMYADESLCTSLRIVQSLRDVYLIFSLNYELYIDRALDSHL